jgi:thiamine-phosphate pyrophosphorylase
MKLIAITTEDFCEGEAEAINLLFGSGLETLHLRKPNATLQEMKDFMKRIKDVFHSRIMISRHFALVNSFNIKGLHLDLSKRRHSERSVDKSALIGASRRQVITGITYSCSCHTFDEIRETPYCDYVYLSPIFDSVSKVGYKQAFTPQQLMDAKRENIIDDCVIALGGITTEKIAAVREFGFGGVAVLGALWGDFADTGNVKELLKRFIRLKTACKTGWTVYYS